MPSLRAKLTAYYLAILAVVLVILGIAIYTLISRGLLETIDDSLSFQATSIEQRIATGESLPDNHAQRSNQLTVSLHLIQLIDSNGNISDQMALKPEYSIPVDITKLRQIPMGDTTHETYVLASGEP